MLEDVVEDDVAIEVVIDDAEDVVIEEAGELEVEVNVEEVEGVVVSPTAVLVVVFPDKEIAAPTPAMIMTIMTITTATILLMPDLLSFI